MEVGIFVLAVGLLSLLTNGVLLVILLKDPLKCFKASTTYFIISLSVSDLLTGANACLWGINELYPFSTSYKKYLLSLFWITVQASFLILLAMSVERFLIVRYPFNCRRWITKKRVSFSIAIIWIISAILGALVLLPPPKILYVQFSIFMEFFVSVFVIAGLYAFILLGVRNSQRSLKGKGQLHKGGFFEKHELGVTRVSFKRKTSIQDIVSSTPPSGMSPPPTPINARSQLKNGGTKPGAGESPYHGYKSPVQDNFGGSKSGTHKKPDGFPMTKNRKFKRFARSNLTAVAREKTKSGEQEKKLTAVVLLLVGVLVLTVLPYLLASQIYVGCIIFGGCSPLPALIDFMHLFFPIELLNFAVNPLIYAWRLPQYRRTLKYLCTCHQAGGYADGTSACDRDGPSYRTASVRIRRD